jgi:hypothetical protein
MAILRESRHCAVDADSFRFGDIERIHPTEALDQLECGRFAHDIDQVVILRQTLWDVQAHAGRGLPASAWRAVSSFGIDSERKKLEASPVVVSKLVGFCFSTFLRMVVSADIKLNRDDFEA